ncbi:MAG: PLDc N-terminal domain-containing protein [Mariniphaga sp.]
MNIGHYIRLLLPEHDTVIIPGLGAFLSTYKPAHLDEKSGKMLPPSREITFESRIKNNDGLLAGTIAQEEGIPLTQAYQELENEREEILYQLDTGEKVVLENLGELYYDQNREVQFSSSGKDNLLLDAYGLESASLTSEPEDNPEEEVQPKASKENEKGKGAFEEETPIAYAGASLRDTRVPPRKRKRAWWLLLFLIPIIGGVIYILINNTDKPPATVEVRIEEPASQEAVLPVDTTTADTVPAIADTTTFDSAAFNDTAVALVDSSAFITPDSSKFYLVRGSFEDYKNADKFVKRLKRQGYEPFHLGRHGSFYLVGIDVFENEIEAYGQQYNYLDKYPESGVWIFIPGKSIILNQ